MAPEQDDGFYRSHIFCCTNERPDGHPRGSCSAKDGLRLRNYMKVRAKEMGLDKVRVNAAGCLDRCELGPVMVVYPEAVWYRPETLEDIDEILVSHIRGGNPVERLRLDPDA